MMPTPVQQFPSLLVFDSRRGNEEGAEDDKVLAVFPSRPAIEDHSRLAGLLQGLILFSSTFGHQRGWDVAETDKSIWVLHEAEPHIWFAAAAPKAWLPRHSTEDTLRAVLLQAHMLTTLLAGTVQELLDQDVSAVTAQEVLLPVLRHVSRQLANPASWLHRELRNPLSPASSYPLLALGPAAAATLLACSNRILLDTVEAGMRPVRELTVLYGPHVLWTSLHCTDAAAIYCMLATALLHPAGAPVASPSSLGALGASAGDIASVGSALDAGAWQLLPSGFVVLRGGLDAAVGSDESAVVAAPPVYLASQRAWARLLPMVEGKLTAALLLDPELPLSSALLARLQASLAGPASQLAMQVAEDIRASRVEAGHVPGFRFLSEHMGAACSAQASPREKISATSHHARALAAGLRDSLARVQPPARGAALTGIASTGSLHKAAAGSAPSWGEEQQLQQQSAHGWGVDAAPHQVLVKSAQECWAAALVDEDRRVLVVRERRTDRSLAEAAERVQELSHALL